MKATSPITAWTGTYLVRDLAGHTTKQARKTLKFWGVILPESETAARRTLRKVGMTIAAGRVRPVGYRPDALTRILGR